MRYADIKKIKILICLFFKQYTLKNPNKRTAFIFTLDKITNNRLLFLAKKNNNNSCFLKFIIHISFMIQL